MNDVKFGDVVEVIKWNYRGKQATFYSWPRIGRKTAWVIVDGKEHCLHIGSLVFKESSINSSNKRKKIPQVEVEERETTEETIPPTTEDTNTTNDKSADVTELTNAVKVMSLHLQTCINNMNNVNDRLSMLERDNK